ncbi:hypothetical protein THAOC_15130 [Thalassiosira oceanica]|uniref:Uncharacterized protein n=1 Tax=Thalassiosira oceanica TaxID=159749 RepID=K0SDK3_THAOC|nr:hypothetical protein THAOC_15130 [Thalassiosira oceanica]|eukprot:EJK64163.1 hypothetical protein THAOC_15130 [Thalassiosira oceanica]
MSELDHLRKKPPDDGGLLLDTNDRRLRRECQECGVKFYIGPEETSQQAFKRRETLRRSINAAKKKRQRVAEKGGEREQVCLQKQALRQDLHRHAETEDAREARLQADRAYKESKREAESRLKMLGHCAFTGDLTRAIDDDHSFCEDQMCLGSFPLRCAISGEVKTFKTANNRTFAQKCFVFSVDSDEEVIKKVQIVCDLFSRVTKPYVSKTGVAGRPHLGVPGKITGSVESADLPEIITALLEGTMNFCLASTPEYFGGSFDREYAEKLVVEAFEEDMGLKMGSGVAENDEEEQDEDQVGEQT